MKLKSNQPKATAEQVVKDIRRATRRHYSTEDKIRIVLSGLRGEDSIAELCRKEGIAQGLYYSCSYFAQHSVFVKRYILKYQCFRNPFG